MLYGPFKDVHPLAGVSAACIGTTDIVARSREMGDGVRYVRQLSVHYLSTLIHCGNGRGGEELSGCDQNDTGACTTRARQSNGGHFVALYLNVTVTVPPFPPKRSLVIVKKRCKVGDQLYLDIPTNI